MASIAANNIVKGIIVVVVILLSVFVIYVVLYPPIKDFFSDGEENLVEENKLEERFNEFLNKIELCKNSNDNCKCTNEVYRFGKGYTLVIEKGGSVANLLDDKKEVKFTRNLNLNNNCVVVNDGGLKPLSLGSYIVFSFEDTDKVVATYKEGNKFVKEKVYFPYKFANGNLCFVTERVYGKKPLSTIFGRDEWKDETNRLFSNKMCIA